MKIANNVEMLEIKHERGILYPVLTWDNNEIVLIDTGLPGQIELLKEAVLHAGFDIEKITKVIITHQDIDHLGNVNILKRYGAEILAHEIETPYIQGDRTNVRLEAMEKRLDTMNDGERSSYEKMKANAPQFYVHVNYLLKDDEFLDICGGIKVIHTPGHTPGHIALLLKESNVIVCGDAANINDGILQGSNPQFTVDMQQAEESFQKMTEMKPDSIICYHGGIYHLSKN